MKLKKVPIDKLIAYENNARVHSPEHVEQIAKSIETFGFNVPVLIDAENNIIAGHGRVMAAKKLGMKDVPTLLIDHLTDDQKKAFILADNQITLNSTWDDKMLKSELNYLKDIDFDITVVGFEDIEIDKILDSIDNGEKEEPQIKFSEFIGEENNYVVLLFKTEIDWLNAQTFFELETVMSRRRNGKPWGKGIGRIIDGAKILTKLTENMVRGHDD